MHMQSHCILGVRNGGCKVQNFGKFWIILLCSAMSFRLFQQILHMQENLLVFTLQFSEGNFEPLIY